MVPSHTPLGGVAWRFDGWDDQVESWRRDEKVCHALLGEAEIRRFRAPLTLEGSAFCSDGEGSLIAYTTTALDNRRNENVTKLDADGVLNQWVGVKRVMWIEHGVGMGPSACELCRACAYLAPGLAVVGEQRNGYWSDALDAIADRLRDLEDGRGQRLKVDRLPFLEHQGQTAGYSTFYILNTAALVPSYDRPEDDHATDLIGSALPGRSARQIPAWDLEAGGTSLSSLIQYQPARLLERSKETLLPKSAWQRPVPDYVGLLETYIEKIDSED